MVRARSAMAYVIALRIPPLRAGREAVAATVIEPVRRAHQAEIAFLQDVAELHAAVAIAAGDRRHQTQVRFDEHVLRGPHLLLGGAHGGKQPLERRGGHAGLALDLRHRGAGLALADGQLAQLPDHLLDAGRFDAELGHGEPEGDGARLAGAGLRDGRVRHLPDAGHAGEELGAGRGLRRRLVAVDAHQVAHPHLAALEAAGDRQQPLEARPRGEHPSRDLAGARPDALAEVDFRLAGEELRAADLPQIRALRIGCRTSGPAACVLTRLDDVRRAALRGLPGRASRKPRSDAAV